MTDPFLTRAACGPMLLDAALGTRLIAAGLDLNFDDPCLRNLDRPAQVLDLHRRDVAAGAEAVFTNTFGANRAWLVRFGREGDAAAINRRGVELARAAAGPTGFVVGSIGPTATGDPAAFLAQVDALLDAGADALALETFRLAPALAALAARPGGLPLGSRRPVLVGIFDWPDPPDDAARRLLQAGADLVGINCSADRTGIERFVDSVAGIAAGRFWLKPATSGPGGAVLTPADFAGLARRLADVGTGLLGGCCGTTEEHLRAIRAAWGWGVEIRGNAVAGRTHGC